MHMRVPGTGSRQGPRGTAVLGYGVQLQKDPCTCQMPERSLPVCEGYVGNAVCLVRYLEEARLIIRLLSRLTYVVLCSRF